MSKDYKDTYLQTL